jgi:hypothetical protein
MIGKVKLKHFYDLSNCNNNKVVKYVKQNYICSQNICLKPEMVLYFKEIGHQIYLLLFRTVTEVAQKLFNQISHFSNYFYHPVQKYLTLGQEKELRTWWAQFLIPFKVGPL